MNGLKEILDRLKIEQLNPMQEASIEAFNKGGEDLILLSPTGSGKTLAFLLPLVGSLRADVKGVQAVVLVPSRELALQIEQVFKAMGTEFKAMSCYGGRPAMEEHRTMKAAGGYHRYARPYERPSLQAELRCKHSEPVGDR